MHEEENFGRFAVNFLEVWQGGGDKGVTAKQVMRRVDERVKEV